MLAEQTLEKLNAMKLYGMAGYMRTWLEQRPDTQLGPTELWRHPRPATTGPGRAA
jgi:hypothetical protein